jgi:hypothetical protein
MKVWNSAAPGGRWRKAKALIFLRLENRAPVRLFAPPWLVTQIVDSEGTRREKGEMGC